jgi:hypothetical protein
MICLIINNWNQNNHENRGSDNILSAVGRNNQRALRHMAILRTAFYSEITTNVLLKF